MEKDRKDYLRQRVSEAVDKSSERDVADQIGISAAAVSDLIEGKRSTHWKTWDKVENWHKRGGRANGADDVPDPDLERVYQEFGAPEDRLLAIEGIAAVNRSRALKHEARAAEREGEAAKIRARATVLAERRALLMCRRAKKPSVDGGRKGPDELPPPEEQPGSGQ